MALTREAITRASLEILHSYGLGDLSMRRVADALSVQAGALYYHVPNKQSLLALVADQILGSVDVPDPGRSVDDWLHGWAGALRQALLAHRDGAELVASSLALGLGGVDPTAPVARRLGEAGLPEQAPTARAFLHLVLGHVVTEQTQTQMLALGVVESFDPQEAARDFEWAVALLVSGVLTRVAA